MAETAYKAASADHHVIFTRLHLRMRFSIIVPVYKVEQYLNQCVQSVLAQSFTDYELILVDDGSPDSCPELCDDYEARYNNVRVLHKLNGGLSSARNAGMRVAKGDYIVFIDSDDWWDDCNALAGINQTIESSNADIVVFRMKKYFQKENRYLCHHILFNDTRAMDIDYLMEHNLFVASACDKAIRRSCVEKYGMSFKVGQLSEDIEWCCKILLFNFSVIFYNNPFYVYRQNNASISHNVRRKNLEDIAEVISNYDTLSNLNEKEPLTIRHFLAQQFVLWIGNSTLVKDEDISNLHNKMKRYWSLLRYNKYPYVKKVNHCRFLGYHIVRILLGVYMNRRLQ